MRKMIESAIRLIDEVNSAVLMGNKDMLGYSHDALEQAISMLTSLESQLTKVENSIDILKKCLEVCLFQCFIVYLHRIYSLINFNLENGK